MKMKKITALLLALTFSCTAVTFAACANKNQGETPPAQELVPDQENDENSQNGGGMVENNPVSPENPPQEEEIAPPIKQTQLYIKSVGNNVNLRSGAGTNYAVLGTAEKNTTYAVIGKTGNWFETYYRGKRAYFYSEYAAVLTLEKSKDEKIENVIQEGYKHIGVPYVYGAVRVHDGKGKLLGGFTAQKFDCSSLIQYIFYKGANILLQVNTRTQFLQGEKIKRANLQRGDCMYFTNSERKHLTGVERVGHVALYLGDNYILHTASDYARIEQISAKRWEYFIEARRFL